MIGEIIKFIIPLILLIFGIVLIFKTKKVESFSLKLGIYSSTTAILIFELFPVFNYLFPSKDKIFPAFPFYTIMIFGFLLIIGIICSLFAVLRLEKKDCL